MGLGDLLARNSSSFAIFKLLFAKTLSLLAVIEELIAKIGEVFAFFLI
ncbi:hypothetical protein [Piscibacillus halophilus]|nr:hypothetical protein [Piscibacillus halophilus]